MEVVELNRRFYEWTETEPPSHDFRRAMGLDEGGVGWEGLLAKRRVVILAEAGSGKSTEINTRARLNRSAGRFTFEAAVEDVGLEGLGAALSASDHKRLAEWHASDQDGWFFIDSVDEAKAKNVRFETVTRKLADGIQGAEERAHVILTGRISDWEFRKDLSSLKDWLPALVPDPTPATTAVEELLRVLRRGLRDQKKEAPHPEQPLVVLMAPLDRDRVLLFAKTKRVPRLDAFIEQVDAAGLWHFARRPLDLDWLVRFWQSENRLGSLAEMVERSVFERLKETSPARSRRDPLDGVRACEALERIGATMVFSRTAAIAIPDSEVAFTADRPLDLADVLRDWSADDQALLLSRPIFDPATLGRVRIHNDNEGVVRGYLTARWLLRLRKSDLPTASLFELLFAKTYGVEVVRPSLIETVGWLSVWDRDVANEVVRRRPSLLLSAGDPASISPDIRQKALAGTVRELLNGENERPWHRQPWWGHEQMRRFAQPDISSTIVSLWGECRKHDVCAQLVMRLLWLGALSQCENLAREAAYDSSLDSVTRVFAGRALLATGTDQAKQDYARYIITESLSLPSGMVQDGFTELFPRVVSLDDLVSILQCDHRPKGSEHEGLLWNVPKLVERLHSPADLERLMSGLFTQVGGGLEEDADGKRNTAEDPCSSAMIAAAVRLLKVSPSNLAPEVAVNAILRVANRRRYENDRKSSVLAEAFRELHRTKQRRRSAFWRAAQIMRAAWHGRYKIETPWQMEMLGYRLDLQFEDADWLLSDGLVRSEHDRRLAVNSVLAMSRSPGAPTGLTKRVARAVAHDAVGRKAYNEWMQPPNRSAAEIALERRRLKIERQNAAAARKREQSWLGFIRDLRGDPERIRGLRTPLAAGVSRDLYGLWQLLDASSQRSGYALSTVSPLEKITGPDVADATRAGLIAHWRSSPPLLRSQRKPEERNSVRHIDLMGLAGISLEADDNEEWAASLSSSEATLAAAYATLELNGFPRWMSALATSKPAEVRDVLVGEIMNEISQPNLAIYDTLNKVANADGTFAALAAPSLLADLESRQNVPETALPMVLQIIVRGIPSQSSKRFVALGIERWGKDIKVAVQYLAAVFSIDARTAIRVLKARLRAMIDAKRAKTIDLFISAAFHNPAFEIGIGAGQVPADVLEQIVRLTFRAVRRNTKGKRLGRVRALDDNDRADYARSAVFDRFAKTPGPFTFHALLRLRDDPACPMPRGVLNALAEDRAIQDSESEPWLPSETLEFEKQYDTVPRTPKDLQSVLVHRIEDMQHDLLHGDFAQGSTLSALRDEVDVQNWLADRLRNKQGQSFSVEREPHVADEKEPDVRVRAKATDASVAMEIKVADSWTLRELEDALARQLCGRYLRAREGRYGVLLLVHQDPGRKRWKDSPAGGWLSFAEVFARLSAQAADIAGSSQDSPRPEVCALDVSECRTRPKKTKEIRPTSIKRRNRRPSKAK